MAPVIGIGHSIGGVAILIAASERSDFENYPPDIWFLPKKLSVPATIVCGEYSDVFIERSVKRFCSKCRSEKPVKIEGEGHLIPMNLMRFYPLSGM